MNNLQFLHVCNHRFKLNNANGIEKEVIINNAEKELVNIIVNGAVVLDIIEVRALTFEPYDQIVNFSYDNSDREQTYEDVDTIDGYYDDDDGFLVDYRKFFTSSTTISDPLPKTFYEPFLHNRVKWNVKPPTKYRMKVRMLYNQNQFTEVTLDECTRCQGKGWYVDLLDNNGAFSIATGIDKISQRVIKDLLTTLGSNKLDENYGTLIHARIAEEGQSDEDLFAGIRLIVSEVEDQYILRQNDELDQLPDDEILVALRVNNILRPKQNPTRILLELTIKTPVETQTFRVAA